MDNFNKLAKEIHKRDNKQSIGVCVGTVVNAEQPIKVSICGGAILLEQGENAFVCQDVIERKYTAKARDSSVEVTYQDDSKRTVKIETDNKLEVELKEVLKAGDQVMCVPCSGEQTWIIVDKVVG